MKAQENATRTSNGVKLPCRQIWVPANSFSQYLYSVWKLVTVSCIWQRTSAWALSDEERSVCTHDHLLIFVLYRFVGAFSLSLPAVTLSAVFICARDLWQQSKKSWSTAYACATLYARAHMHAHSSKFCTHVTQRAACRLFFKIAYSDGGSEKCNKLFVFLVCRATSSRHAPYVHWIQIILTFFHTLIIEQSSCCLASAHLKLSNVT